MPHVIPPAERPRRIVVVGAGPGGLEAARVAGERGHDVIAAGGDAVGRRADPPRRAQPAPPGPAWASSTGGSAELERLGVDVRYDTFADADVVASLDPDVVIVATGGLPQLPELEAGEDLVVTSWDVLGGDVTPTRRRAVLRRQRHALGAVGGGADRPLRRQPRDRHARADVRRSRSAA